MSGRRAKANRKERPLAVPNTYTSRANSCGDRCAVTLCGAVSGGALWSLALTNEYPIDGGCDCGLIRYRVLTKPLFVHCCHCRWCQRETGASFALNAMIEADYVIHLGPEPEVINTPSSSGKGQKIARCPQCRVAVWSNYSSAGPLIRFVRVGTLDCPDHLPPDIHIFTGSKQPWVQLSADIPSVREFYDRESYWPAESLARRRLLLPRIQAYQASLVAD